MITYSRQEMQKELVADQAVWSRLPVAFGSVLWPSEILLLGWNTGWWTGLLTVVALGISSLLLPPRLRISIYLVDLLDRLVRLPLALAWLLLIWHLAQREPFFAPFGQPLVGALVATAALWAATRLLTLLSRFATGQVAGRFSSARHRG